MSHLSDQTLYLTIDVLHILKTDMEEEGILDYYRHFKKVQFQITSCATSEAAEWLDMVRWLSPLINPQELEFYFDPSYVSTVSTFSAGLALSRLTSLHITEVPLDMTLVLLQKCSYTLTTLQMQYISDSQATRQVRSSCPDLPRLTELTLSLSALDGEELATLIHNSLLLYFIDRMSALRKMQWIPFREDIEGVYLQARMWSAVGELGITTNPSIFPVLPQAPVNREVMTRLAMHMSHLQTLDIHCVESAAIPFFPRYMKQLKLHNVRRNHLSLLDEWLAGGGGANTVKEICITRWANDFTMSASTSDTREIERERFRQICKRHGVHLIESL